MITKSKVTIGVPYTQKKDNRKFSFRVKQTLSNEWPEYTQPSKLLALSDISGNFKTLQSLLIRNKVIDKNYEWIFEDGHLVIVGDCFDKHEKAIECLWLIYSLEERARRSGGYVHFILGNHEIMSLNGSWRNQHPQYFIDSKHRNIYSTALYDGNNEIWRWLQTKNIMEKIGDVLFVHGGIASEINKLPLSLAEINKLARPCYTSANQAFFDASLNAIFSAKSSPFWYRGYYRGVATEDQIAKTLNKFNISTIVTGHTKVQKIESFFGGKVININATHIHIRAEVLMIENNEFLRVNTDGSKEKIK